jgi:hypothetical protein
MSENTREITLEEAKKLYTSSEEAKAFLLSKFTKDELEGKPIPTQEEFNKFFEENIFPLIDYSKTKFLDSNFDISKIPTSKIELRDSNDRWLFDYNYDQKNQRFYYSYDRVCAIFMEQFDLQDVDRSRLMKSLVEKHFNLRDTQPALLRKQPTFIVE